MSDAMVITLFFIIFMAIIVMAVLYLEHHW
ncbi:small membrane protein YldA [Enterobacter cloacae complex sp. 2024EL-00215]|jgi:hypothetical protein|nr:MULTISPECIES: small membrane protein YldA [Enterobacter]BBS36205.1 hypothetical protein WP5S18E01_10520 [Enterobacter cloacae]